MSIFDKPAPGPLQAPPAAGELPPEITYQVLLANGNSIEVRGHNTVVDSGVLIFVRAVWANENCTAVRTVPGDVFAPGEWRRATTRYNGYRKSPLAI